MMGLVKVGKFVIILTCTLFNEIWAQPEREDISVQKGETLTMKCGNKELTTRVFWKRGPEILSYEKTVFYTPDRISVLDDFTLQIESITLDDENVYECQIPNESTFYYKVTVTVPPSVDISGNQEDRIVMLGAPLSIECVGMGKPDPEITWTKDGGDLPENVEIDETTLLINSVTYDDDGQYDCTASNGVGKPAKVSATVEVHYEPKAIIDQDVIFTGPGRTLSIICTVDGSPTPDVKWYFNGNLTKNISVRKSQLSTMNQIKHNFTIYPLSIEDMGQYECFANNPYGHGSDAVNLTAIPQKPVVTSKAISEYSEAYRISWRVQSVNELVSSKIMVRMVNVTDTGPWLEINVPVERKKSQRENYELTFDISGLTPETNYEAMVQAENYYGFGDFSDVLIFETPKNDNNTLSAPTTTSKPEIPVKMDATEYQPFPSDSTGIANATGYSLSLFWLFSTLMLATWLTL